MGFVLGSVVHVLVESIHAGGLVGRGFSVAAGAAGNGPRAVSWGAQRLASLMGYNFINVFWLAAFVVPGVDDH